MGIITSNIQVLMKIGVQFYTGTTILNKTQFLIINLNSNVT